MSWMTPDSSIRFVIRRAREMWGISDGCAEPREGSRNHRLCGGRAVIRTPNRVSTFCNTRIAARNEFSTLFRSQLQPGHGPAVEKGGLPANHTVNESLRRVFPCNS